jgi:hypothetical protein
MIKKFEQFIKESFCLDLLSEIEQRFIVLDDMDYEYTIEEYIEGANNFNTYNVGYLINPNNKILNIGEISSVIRYFEKFYNVYTKFGFIIITEEKILTKDEVLNMLLTEEQIKKVEEFSQDIFNRMIKKDNVWYIDNQWLFDLDYDVLLQEHKMLCCYIEWWSFFVNHINIHEFIEAISKALLEDYLKYNVFKPSWN